MALYLESNLYGINILSNLFGINIFFNIWNNLISFHIFIIVIIAGHNGIEIVAFFWKLYSL